MGEPDVRPSGRTSVNTAQPVSHVERARRHAPVVASLAVTLTLAATWVSFTALTGKTYHLAPAVIAVAPGWMARVMHTSARAGLVVTIGVGVVALGWLTILIGGVAPDVTMVSGQPGGVPGEVAIAAVLGVLVSLFAVRSTPSVRGGGGR